MIRRLAAPVALLSAGPVSAHGTFAGGGGFYAGVAHPVLARDHLLCLLALGLLLGRGQAVHRHRLALILVLALATGLSLGAGGYGWAGTPPAILALATTCGMVAAAGTAPPFVAMAALTLAVGVAVGLDTGAPVASTGAGVAASVAPYAGVVLGVALIVGNAAALAAAAGMRPLVIAVRVAGSWIAAAALMVLALQTRSLVGAA